MQDLVVVKWHTPKPQSKDFGGDSGTGQPPYPGEAEVRCWDPDCLWVVVAAISVVTGKNPRGRSTFCLDLGLGGLVSYLPDGHDIHDGCCCYDQLGRLLWCLNVGIAMTDILTHLLTKFGGIVRFHISCLQG